MDSEVFFVNMWTKKGVSKMAEKRGGGTPRAKAKSFFLGPTP